MSEDIKVDKKADIKPSEEKKKMATWGFKYKSYMEITPFLDTLANKTRSGETTRKTIKARNWRLDLDLEQPDQKQLHDYLLKHKDRNNCFWMLEDKGKNDKVAEDAKTLKKLNEMSIPQLMQCIEPSELRGLGISSPSGLDKYELIAAILRLKKINI